MVIILFSTKCTKYTLDRWLKQLSFPYKSYFFYVRGVFSTVLTPKWPFWGVKWGKKVVFWLGFFGDVNYSLPSWWNSHYVGGSFCHFDLLAFYFTLKNTKNTVFTIFWWYFWHGVSSFTLCLRLSTLFPISFLGTFWEEFMEPFFSRPFFWFSFWQPRDYFWHGENFISY